MSLGVYLRPGRGFLGSDPKTAMKPPCSGCQDFGWVAWISLDPGKDEYAKRPEYLVCEDCKNFRGLPKPE